MTTRQPPAPLPRRRPPAPPSPVARWMPAIAAASVLGIVVFAGVSGGGSGSGSPTTDSGAIIDSSLTVPAATLEPVVIATDPAMQKTQLSAPLSFGMAGSQVRALQQRLTELGFQPGPIDGQYGAGTQQALWAFEKLVLGTPYADATGVLTNDMWQVMQDGIVIQPRRTETTPTHVEIYLDKQVLIVFQGTKAAFITHISSGKLDAEGKPETFCEEVTIDTDQNGVALPEPITKGICAESKTPGGVFRFDRRYEGKRLSPLGGMYDPVYFNYGIAVHGALEVPRTPASHGCIRIPKFLSTVFPALVAKGDQVFVWDGKKEPEQQSKNEMLPSFNRPDPDYTTTTSSTSTTTTTTVRPATTVPPPPTTVTPAPTTAPATTVPPTTTPPPTSSSSSVPTSGG